MNGAPWWVVLAAAAVGAAAAIVGAVWVSRVQRRSAARAEWFRRLHWAWQLTQVSDVHSVAAGMTMMEYLINSSDRQDGAIIAGIAPLARDLGLLASQYPSESTDLDVSVNDGHTGGGDARREGGDHAED